jgi:hypothetical protein
LEDGRAQVACSVDNSPWASGNHFSEEAMENTQL